MSNKEETKKADDTATKTPKLYEKVDVKKLPKGEIEIIGSLPADALDKNWQKAVTEVSKHVKLDGFRDGKIPESILLKEVGDMVILDQAAELALREAYPSIIMDNNLEVIGTPRVQITKLAKGNPIEFSVKTAIVPVLELDKNYEKSVEKINKKDEKAEVTEEDIEKVINQLRENRARLNKHKDHVHKEGEVHDHEHDDDEKKDEKDWPAFDDEFAKTLGDFKDVADFKEKVKGQMLKQKESELKDKMRGEIIETLLKESSVEIPDILIESEQDKMYAQFSGDIEHAGMKMDDYLKQLGKTVEDIKKEWSESAEKRVKTQLLLNKIAVEKELIPTPEEIDKDTDQLMQMYKDADRNRVRIYATSMLANEKVFEYLEKIGR